PTTKHRTSPPVAGAGAVDSRRAEDRRAPAPPRRPLISADPLCYPPASHKRFSREKGRAMRLTRDQMGQISRRIVRGLIKDELITADDPEKTIDLIVQVFTEDLAAEDKLNDEVREILQGHADEISRGMVNYQ